MIIILVCVFFGVFFIGFILEDYREYEVVGTVKDFTISVGGYGKPSAATVELYDGRKIALYSRLSLLKRGSTIISEEGMIVDYTVKIE